MKRYIYMAIAIALMIPAVLYVGSTFAWYIIVNDNSAISQNVGILQVEISYDSEVQGTSEFVLENVGTLPAYVRIGYTFVYRDDQGHDLISDVSGVTTSDWKLLVESDDLLPEGVNLPLEHITFPLAVGAQTYQKPFLVPHDPGANAYYYKLLPHEKLNGYCKVAQQGQPKAGEALHVVWVAEALQTGKPIVEKAVGYGWDPAKAQLND